MHRETTFGTPSDLGTYVGFEVWGADVHVDGLEAHVDAENKHWTASRPLGPQDVVGELLLRRQSMECVSHDGGTGGGISRCSASAYLDIAFELGPPLAVRPFLRSCRSE